MHVLPGIGLHPAPFLFLCQYKVSIFIPALQAMSRCGFPKMDTKKAANLFQDLLLFGAIAKEPSNFYARTGCDFQSSYSTSRFQKIADTHTPIA